MKDKEVVLITGGEGNIAKAVIERYLENGCIVIATDIKEESGNSEFLQNERYRYYKCDVTSVGDIKDLKNKVCETYRKNNALC